MKHIFRKIHLWLSVPFGIVMTLICFSGAMLVFEKEITGVADGRLCKVGRMGGEPLPLGVLAAKVGASLPPGVSVTGITVGGDPGDAYRVSLSKPRRAYVFVDQYTGEIKGRRERPAFFSFMFSLHRWLLDKGRPEGRPAYGKIVVGVSTMMFALALLSGVAVWWPKSRRGLRNGLKITVGKGRFRLWRSLHAAGGMYAVVLLLAMALTGLTWSFPWYSKAFYAVLGLDAPARGGGGAQRAGDGAASITVGYGTASVSSAKFGNTRAADRYTFDPSTGRLTSAVKYADAAPQGKVRGWIYSVHTGTFGGLLTRILWFLAALFGATLPLTGYYLWLVRRRA